MKKVAIAIQKGGSHKTTLTGCIGQSLSRKGYKTIMIDCDSQGNLTDWHLNGSIEYELTDILMGKADPKDAVIPLSETLSIIPTISINGGLREYAQTKIINEPLVFQYLTEDIEKFGFAFILFDLSPAMNLLERSIILAADEVLTPLDAEIFNLDGIELFNNELQKIRKAFRRDIKHDKLIVSGVNQSFRRHRMILEKLKDFDYSVFVVPQDSKIPECQINKLSIYEYDPGSRVIPEINRIADILIKEV